MRNSNVLNFFDKLKFDEKTRHCNAFKKHATSDVFGTYVGLAGALENLERIYMLDSNNKSDKFHEVAQSELYRDSFKHEFLKFLGCFSVAATSI